MTEPQSLPVAMDDRPPDVGVECNKAGSGRHAMSQAAHGAAVHVDDLRIAGRIDRIPFSRWHLKMVVPIGAGWFFDAFDALAIVYVLPTLIGLWHLTPLKIGLLISSGFTGQMIGAMVFGWLAERVGRVRAIQYSLTLFSIVSLLAAATWSFPSLALVRLVQGLGLGGQVPVLAAYVSEWTPADRRGRYTLLYQSLYALGIVACGAAASWIIPAFGWKWLFVAGALPAVVALPLGRIMPESPRWLASRQRFDQADAVLRGVEEEVSRGLSSVLPPIRPGLEEVSRPPGRFSDLLGSYRTRTIVIWSIWFCTFFVLYALSSWMPSIFRIVYHASPRESVAFGFHLSLVAALTVFIAAMLIDYVGRRPLFITAMAITALPLLVLASGRYGSFETLKLLLFLSYGGICVLGIGLNTYTAELYPTWIRALGVGCGSAWQRFASVIGPLLIGASLPVTGISSIYAALAAVAAAGMVVVILFGIETRGSSLEDIASTTS